MWYDPNADLRAYWENRIVFDDWAGSEYIQPKGNTMDINTVELTIENLDNIWDNLTEDEQNKLFSRVGREKEKTFTTQLYIKIARRMKSLVNYDINSQKKISAEIREKITKMRERGNTEAQIKEKICKQYPTDLYLNGFNVALDFSDPNADAVVISFKKVEIK